MKVLDLFEKLNGLPFGSRIFTFMVCMNAPYFFSIKSHVTLLEKNRCEVQLKKRRAVTNHIKTETQGQILWKLFSVTIKCP